MGEVHRLPEPSERSVWERYFSPWAEQHAQRYPTHKVLRSLKGPDYCITCHESCPMAQLIEIHQETT